MRKMNHPKLKLPKPDVHAAHPFKNAANHKLLLEYVQDRLLIGKNERDKRIVRYGKIDREVAGWQKLSDEDKARATKQDQTGEAQATNINLPITYIHLDDMMTYFAQTFSPTRGMFYHTGKPDEVNDASQIVTLMNNHAIYAGYFREVLQGIYALLKYNEGGFTVNWSKDQGPKLVRPEGEKEDVLEIATRWEGNRLEAIDVYNHLYDPMVHPTKLHCDGEFSAIVKVRSHFWLQQKASEGAYYNCDAAFALEAPNVQTKYYEHPPVSARMTQDQSGGKNNWMAIMTESSGGVIAGYELVECYIKLNPVDFGLVPPNQKALRARYETWRITILNDMYIIDATYMNNVHGNLPHYVGVLNDDLMSTSQKSTAEILMPLQSFASFLLNTHVAATRKNIWNLICYDPSAIDLKLIPPGEVAGRIPLKPGAAGRNINEILWSPDSRLDTKQTMQDLDSVMNIIGQFFPTQSLPSQIANIDRAVDSQVAAVQQGANRRQQKAARLLDDTLFRPVRFAMYYNIIQYQPDQAEITDFYTNKPVTIDLQKLRQTDLPFIIGQGLKSIDRQAVAGRLQEIIFALIQAPQAAQGVDLLGLIDYWTSMLDIDISMEQFRVQPPAVPGVAEAGMAGAGGGNPIQPATAPGAVTAPIYG